MRGKMKVRIDPLDTLFSRVVRLKADGRCEYCLQSFPLEKLQTSHFHGRRKLSTRFDFENVCAVCYSCHNFFHEHPNMHVAFFEKRLGTERFEALNIRANMIIKMSVHDRHELKKKLKDMIKELEK